MHLSFDKALLLFSLCLAACASSKQGTDASVALDAGVLDSGATDQGVAEAGPADTGPSDTDPADAADVDAGRVDSGVDSGVDAGAPDAGPPDTGALDWRLVVTVGGESRLAVVDLDADGSMTEQAAMSLALPSRPGALAYEPATRRFYVGLGGGNSGFATVSMDQAGQLSLLGRTPTDNPTYLGTSASGGAVVAPFYSQGVVRSFDVSGAPPHPQFDEEATTTQPHAAPRGPQNLFYVPHTGGNEIRWYSVEPDGQLMLRGQTSPPANDEPRHIAFHPTRDLAYVVNERSLSVGTYTVDANGSLTLVDTETALPRPVQGGDTGADIHVHPSGSFVYSSNRGHDSIARFSVQGDGTLLFLGATATEARPREFEITPDGRLLIALGQDSGRLASYLIESNGDLTPVTQLSVGPDLRWAIALER